MAAQGEVTRLLRAYRDGDRSAFDRLVPMLYEELRGVARGQLRGRPSGTLDTTALVHEVYLKMSRQEGLAVNDRGHFLAVAARAMRQVLVSYARARTAAKRGGGDAPETLEESDAAVSRHAEEVIDVDRTLEKLRAFNERLATVVECRYFAGLSEQETAEALGVSVRTAQRDWQRARAWIRESMTASPP